MKSDTLEESYIYQHPISETTLQQCYREIRKPDLLLFLILWQC